MIPIKDNAHLLTLANQRYHHPGMYEIIFYCHDGHALCAKCVKNNFKEIIESRHVDNPSPWKAWNVRGYINTNAVHKAGLSCSACHHTFGEPQTDDLNDHNGAPVPAFNVTLHDKLWTVTCVNNGNAFSGYDLRYTMERALESVGIVPTGELSETERQDAITEYYKDGPRGDRRYNRAQIALELEHTAFGHAYYGNALRVAKDVPGVTDEDRSLLDRFATGRQGGMDFMRLQDLALRLNEVPHDNT